MDYDVAVTASWQRQLLLNLVKLRYGDHWFWVEDRDHPSKGMFSFLLILMSLADVDPGKGMPLITIPAN